MSDCKRLAKDVSLIHETSLILARKAQEAGIRAFIGKLSMDESPVRVRGLLAGICSNEYHQRPSYGEASPAASLSSLNSFLDSMESYLSQFPSHRRLVQPIITPRFVPVCSDELLQGLAKVAQDRNVRLQSHMCEGRDQIDMSLKTKGLDDEKVFDKVRLSLRTSHQPV